MKEVILSADSNRYVYLVPNQVADNLVQYCQFFANDWVVNSPDARKLVKNRNKFNETHFILYLNTRVFPNEPAYLMKDLGVINDETDLPAAYANLPSFNF